MVIVTRSFGVYYSNSSQVSTTKSIMLDKYTCLTAERFELITSRYEAFQDACNDLSKDPVKVFDPLSKKSMDELLLIREVSKDLQKKKEEDVKKAAQIAEEQNQTEAPAADEEKKPDTEN